MLKRNSRVLRVLSNDVEKRVYDFLYLLDMIDHSFFHKCFDFIFISNVAYSEDQIADLLHVSVRTLQRKIVKILRAIDVIATLDSEMISL